VELDDGHGESDGHKRADQVPNLEKKKEKNKNQRDQGKCIKYIFILALNTIEGVSVFRIDSHTIKMENLWLNSYRVPLGNIILVYAFRDLVC
jgi:hypothetical protein